MAVARSATEQRTRRLEDVRSVYHLRGNVASVDTNAILASSLSGPLLSIAELKMNQVTDQINVALDQVYAMTVQIGLAALQGNEKAQKQCSALIACGFMQRLINIRLRQSQGHLLCHHTDTSIPLLDCLNQLPDVKIKMPAAAKGQASVPIDEEEYGTLKMKYMKENKQKMKAFAKAYMK